MSGRYIKRRSGALLWLAEGYNKMPQASLDSVSILGGAALCFTVILFYRARSCVLSSEIRAEG